MLGKVSRFGVAVALAVIVTGQVPAQEMQTAPISTAATQAAYAGPPPIGKSAAIDKTAATDTRLTTNGSPQNETSIAGDPSDASCIVCGFNDYSVIATGFGGNGVAFSGDGGATWTHLSGLGGGIPLPAGFTTSGGDPGLAFNTTGRVFYSHIAAAAGGTFTKNNGVFMSHSDDCGATWAATSAVVSHIWPGSGTVPFEDKPFPAVDDHSATATAGRVYISWTRFYDGAHPADAVTGGGDILLSYTDAGTSVGPWAAPIIISSLALEPLNGGTGSLGSSFVQGSEPEVEADGDVYVAYWFGGRINVSRAPAPAAAAPPVFAAPTKPFGTSFGVASIGSPLPCETLRDNAFPNIETDPTRPDHVYVVATDGTPTGAGRDAADVIFARSTDNGATWGPTIILNDDAGATNHNQFFPWMAVSGSGIICVLWYDTRLDPAPGDGICDLDVFSTFSTDGGVTFAPNVKVTDASFDPNLGSPFIGATFFGDYNALGVTLPDGKFHGAWTDNRVGEQEIFYDFFTEDEKIPVELLSFSASARPGAIELSWSTASETENAGFDIYRAETADGHFQRINESRIRAAGNSARQHDYEFIDTRVLPQKTYYYKLADIDFDGQITLHGPIAAVTGSNPEAYQLSQNYPNPFSTAGPMKTAGIFGNSAASLGTTISYSLREAGEVKIRVFNALGQVVRTLVDGHREVGVHSVSWNGTDDAGRRLPSGTYIYQMLINGHQEFKRMSITK